MYAPMERRRRNGGELIHTKETVEKVGMLYKMKIWLAKGVCFSLAGGLVYNYSCCKKSIKNTNAINERWLDVHDGIG